MRTTLTLDDDVAKKLKELARRGGVSFKEVVNSVLRRGLEARETSPRRERFTVDTFRSAFQPGVDPGHLNQLADDLEVADAMLTRR